MSRREVEPVGQAVHLHGNSGLERHLEDAVEIERVLGPVIQDPALRVGETRRRRVLHGLEHACSQSVASPPLASVQADLHPFELREDVVG